MPYPISLPDSHLITFLREEFHLSFTEKPFSSQQTQIHIEMYYFFCGIPTAEFKFIWAAMMDLDRSCIALWEGRRVEVERDCMASHSQSQGIVGLICV